MSGDTNKKDLKVTDVYLEGDGCIPQGDGCMSSTGLLKRVPVVVEFKHNKVSLTRTKSCPYI